MEPIFETIRTYIDGQHEAMLKLWEELVNTESGSRNLEGVAAVTDILRREMEATEREIAEIIAAHNARSL